ncbi:calcium-translocating P-type ATPase [Thozetella sp. PMI_491]|nr:calcium-translocating P-type ATPase [Thozetella sp. PMI_491]
MDRDAGPGSPFSLTVEQLRNLHSPKNLAAFVQIGGLLGLEVGLRTDQHSGLSRRLWFGDNMLPIKPTPSFPMFLWASFNDPVLFILSAAAVVSLAIGLYQTFATTPTPGSPPIEWVEGVAILVAILVIVLVGSINDWEKQRQFKKLNRRQLQRDIKVLRSGAMRLIAIQDILVGDVVHIEPGDVIPADGILISGFHVGCDESAATGEADVIYKRPGDEVFKQAIANPSSMEMEHQGQDPFILSGTSVVAGVGTFLVTATGINSTYGKVLLSFDHNTKPTPLQVRLGVFAKHISRIGAVLALILFTVLFVRFLVGLPHSTETSAQKGQNFVNILILALTVLVIAVPEGLPLAVTLSLAFATTRMLKDGNLVRHLRACETMGNATSICSDKTGTLTENIMTVATGIVGTKLEFSDTDLAAQEPQQHMKGGEVTTRTMVSPSTLKISLESCLRAELLRSIVMNSTAFETNDDASFVGSSTECALLRFAKSSLGMGSVETERAKGKIVQMIPFDAVKKCMITVSRLPGADNRYRAYVKGGSEVLLANCTAVCDTERGTLKHRDLSGQERRQLAEMIEHYASRSLRTMLLAYRDIELPPALGGETGTTGSLSDDEARTLLTFDHIFQDLIFLCIIGIHDPLRPGVPAAVRDCQRAGITVRMVTGDNIQTARAIAQECNIISKLATHDSIGNSGTGSNDVENSGSRESDIVMEGSRFRGLGEEEMDAVIPRLRVLARASAEDKRTLVMRLKAMGEIVAATGDGANDASALSAADIGFSMGNISGTEIAREASSIVLTKDDFTSIVKAVMWGRAINNAVKKFLLFQITVTITSVGLAFVSAIASPSQQSVLTPVQLMWVNLFQDTLAALALATDPPQQRVLDQRPEKRSAPLVTTPMWKMVFWQSTYQQAVTLTLYFAGGIIAPSGSGLVGKRLAAMVFNTYVWMQIFNMYNSRQFDNTLNILEGVLQNWPFLGVSAVMVGGQLLISFVGGQAFSVVPLTGGEWAASIALGAGSLLVGILVRLSPDGPFEKAGRGIRRLLTMKP